MPEPVAYEYRVWTASMTSRDWMPCPRCERMDMHFYGVMGSGESLVCAFCWHSPSPDSAQKDNPDA